MPKSVRPLVQGISSKNILRSFLLLSLMSLLTYYSSDANSLARSSGDSYLWFPYCTRANFPSECKSYDSDGFAEAEKQGICMDDNLTVTEVPDVWVYAYGTCGAPFHVWNEAQVNGEDRDPGLDGTYSNYVLITGDQLDRGYIAWHCDGWRDEWIVADNPCP